MRGKLWQRRIHLSKFKFASLRSSSIRSILYHSKNVTSIAMLKNTSSAGRVNFLGTHRFELSCIFRKKKPAKQGSAGSALSWPITSLNAIARTQRTFSCRSRLSPHRHPRIGCVPPWQSNSAHASGYRTDGERYCRKSDLVGWAANWKPIETFLYDWWPSKRGATSTGDWLKHLWTLSQPRLPRIRTCDP